MKVITSSLERKIKSLIPSSIKTILLLFFVNKVFGKFIKLLKIRWNLFGGYFDYSLVSDTEAACIFWGIWESAEIRFSKRFATSKTIIELGSSVGVTLGVLSNIRKNTKFICVEASTKNYDKLVRLQTQLSTDNNYILLNNAIAYGLDKVAFEHTATASSKINIDATSSTDATNFVAAKTLSNIISDNKVSDDFVLITDIEGAEAAIFFEDESALDKCSRIIAELEDTSLYTMQQQIDKLKTIGFSLKERYGNVVFMSR